MKKYPIKKYFVLHFLVLLTLIFFGCEGENSSVEGYWRWERSSRDVIKLSRGVYTNPDRQICSYHLDSDSMRLECPEYVSIYKFYMPNSNTLILENVFGEKLRYVKISEKEYEEAYELEVF